MRHGLLRVHDHELVLVGQLVESGAGGEIQAVLPAAVQRQDQRRLRGAPQAAWDVHLVRARSRDAGVAEGPPAAPPGGRELDGAPARRAGVAREAGRVAEVAFGRFFRPAGTEAGRAALAADLTALVTAAAGDGARRRRLRGGAGRNAFISAEGRLEVRLRGTKVGQLLVSRHRGGVTTIGRGFPIDHRPSPDVR